MYNLCIYTACGWRCRWRVNNKHIEFMRAFETYKISERPTRERVRIFCVVFLSFFLCWNQNERARIMND